METACSDKYGELAPTYAGLASWQVSGCIAGGGFIAPTNEFVQCFLRFFYRENRRRQKLFVPGFAALLGAGADLAGMGLGG